MTLMSAKVRNPFSFIHDPGLYHDYRPRYHDEVLPFLEGFFKEPPEYALDVACGTGHSTETLAKLCSQVVGVDSSQEMIAEAKKRYQDLVFVVGDAESLPFEDEMFDLVNISMGLHWVDHHLFLGEVSRVLKNSGHLVTDNFGFEGVVINIKTEQEEHFNFFEDFLPEANRNKSYSEKGLLHVNSLVVKDEFSFKKIVTMNENSFVNFLQTTSNFLILSDEEKADATNRMNSLYNKIFKEADLKLGFGGEIKIYQKQS
jgi:ubiquinone/menaquinone biosynthesis C-methylase UbiE